MAVVENGDIVGCGFDVGNDMRREDDDTFVCKVGEDISESDTFCWIKPDRRFVDDQ
ncbi:hypothetical protein [Haloarcula argentinensis]|uniref:hypothetical protein n=1 Tax=Haloarcula argentinensis TaxID=43776 RepID=UPI0023F6881E|nr:hypothetical protein [Haloarcula argentinensis]